MGSLHVATAVADFLEWHPSSMQAGGAGFCASIWHLPVINSVQEATRRVPSGAAGSNDDGEPCGIRTHDTLIKSPGILLAAHSPLAKANPMKTTPPF